MRFTALEEYGLRCILHLAREKGARLTLKKIADEEGLTLQYAGKIFRALGKSGLVESERGRRGGYRLSRRPEDILVLEVLTALDGRFFEPKLCGRYRGIRKRCVNAGACAVRLLWLETDGAIAEVLSRYSLRDLVERERRLREDSRIALPVGNFVPLKEESAPVGAKRSLMRRRA